MTEAPDAAGAALPGAAGRRGDAAGGARNHLLGRARGEPPRQPREPPPPPPKTKLHIRPQIDRVNLLNMGCLGSSQLPVGVEASADERAPHI